ncbi:MAG TPA: proline dehydrogenase family protein [Longimicrobiales bacterium]|nr:proline dehydrogenase family protein [Longimicrobiales bacterium]
MLRATLLKLSESGIARRVATRAPLASTFAHRFVAGDTVDDAVAATRALNRAGMSVTLDYLGESVSSREEARAAADTYLAVLDHIAAEGLDANVSLKLTAMGQDIDEEFLRENVGRVIERAAAHDILVRFDMEGSDYTQPTLDFFRRLWNEGVRNIGPVIQSYLYRSSDDIAWLNSIGARVRLCKGAYQEPATVAFPEKSEVDAAFVRLAKALLDDGNYPGIATHDLAMINATIEHVKRRGYSADRFEFQMLYGVRRDFQSSLVEQGMRLRVYVPFGEAWYPYLMRRMAERPANLFFIAGSVLKEALPGR